MLSPSGGPTDRLEISPEAEVKRLRRRVAALERQLQARIAQVDDLRDRLTRQERRLAAADGEASRTPQDADPRIAEYEALMNTLTMRALRRPRDWYAAARRRLVRP